MSLQHRIWPTNKTLNAAVDRLPVPGVFLLLLRSHRAHYEKHEVDGIVLVSKKVHRLIFINVVCSEIKLCVKWRATVIILESKHVNS